MTNVRYWQILLQKSVARDARARFDFLKSLCAAPLSYSAGLMWHWGRFQRLRGTNGDYWRWSGYQFGEPTKVLSDGCQRELVLRTIRAA